MFVVSFLLAEVSRRWLEGPLLSLKDRVKFKAIRPTAIYQGPHFEAQQSQGAIRSAIESEAD